MPIGNDARAGYVDADPPGQVHVAGTEAIDQVVSVRREAEGRALRSQRRQAHRAVNVLMWTSVTKLGAVVSCTVTRKRSAALKTISSPPGLM